MEIFLLVLEYLPFMEGFVKAVEPETVVRIFNTNTNKVIEGMFQSEMVSSLLMVILPSMVFWHRCSYYIIFLGTRRSKTGKLLPTGNVQDTITLVDGH